MKARIAHGLPAQSRLGQYGYHKAALASDPPPVDEDQARHVRWIYEQRTKGWGFERIAKSLNDRGIQSPRGGIWYGTAVHQIVRNPLYRGAVTWGDHVTAPR